MSKALSFDYSFRSFDGELASSDTADSNFDHDQEVGAACSAASSSSSSAIIHVAGRHHLDREQEAQYDRACTRHQSAPVDVVPPSQWMSYRSEKGGNAQSRWMRRIEAWEEDEEEEEEEEEEPAAQEEERRLPPHEELARERAAATSCGGTAFSLCQGVGRTLKGRDLCRVRNAILKQTGFIS